MGDECRMPSPATCHTQEQRIKETLHSYNHGTIFQLISRQLFDPVLRLIDMNHFDDSRDDATLVALVLGG